MVRVWSRRTNQEANQQSNLASPKKERNMNTQGDEFLIISLFHASLLVR